MQSPMSPLFIVVVVLLATMAAVRSAPRSDKEKLAFKVSARDLKSPRLGKTSPYVKISYTENDKSKEIKIEKSSTITNTNSPDWADTFNIDFDRSKHQRLHFVVKTHDLIGASENLGEAWVTLNDYVDNDQKDVTAQLNKKGYIIMKKA